MKKFTICLFAILTTIPLFAKTYSLQEAISKGSSEICKKIDGNINTVVIVDVQADSERLSDYIYSELNNNFVVNLKTTAVAERNDSTLSLIKKEFDYQNSGEVSDDSIQSVGNSLGADCLVFGKLEDASSGWKFTLKAVQVETKKILSVWSGTVSRNDKDVKYYIASKKSNQQENIEKDSTSNTAVENKIETETKTAERKVKVSDIQASKEQVSTAEWLFPLYGCEIGKTTVKEMKKLGKKKWFENYYIINDRLFWYDNDTKVFDHMYITRNSWIPEWEERGYSPSLSYNEWISFLKSRGYDVKVKYPPKLQQQYSYYSKTSLEATVVALNKFPIQHYIKLDFSYSGHTGLNDKNTLYSFMVSTGSYYIDSWTSIEDKSGASERNYEKTVTDLLLRNAPIKSCGWKWENGYTINGNTFYDVSESYKEQAGTVNVEGHGELLYYLYDTYSYLDGDTSPFTTKYLPYWIESMGYSISSIRKVYPNKNLSENVKSLMWKRNCDVSIVLCDENTNNPYICFNSFDKSANLYSTYIYILKRN
ncbi:MAG: hypothetical protein IJP62_13360 [Treponema sp.]|nr:hypothetical protein [Treponema sp.]